MEGDGEPAEQQMEKEAEAPPPAPQKIALKVPTLFFKSATTKSASAPTAKSATNNDKNEETPNSRSTPKPKRPMPASARKKLEDAKAETDNSISNGHEQTSGSEEKTHETEESDSRKSAAVEEKEEAKPKPARRPGPASARHKLSQRSKSPEKNSSQNLDNKNETSESEETPHPPEVPNKDKDSQKKPSRAMPLFAKKKLEASKEATSADSPATAEENNEASLLDDASTSPPPKKSRPGPASAKRRLEEKAKDIYSSLKSRSSSNHDSPEEKEVASSRVETSLLSEEEPVPSPDADKTEEDTVDKSQDVSSEKKEVQVDAEPEKKKVNISLGGIKFPTFKKPMPTSVRLRLEAKNSEQKLKTDDGEKQEEPPKASEADTEIPAESQRRGRSGGSKELQSLLNEKFACQYCGEEFYQLSKKTSHEQKHLTDSLKPVEDKPNVNSSKSSSKVKNWPKPCPTCKKQLWNSKKYKGHVSNCGKSKAKKSTGTEAVKTVKSSIIYKCDHCDKEFHDKLQLLNHVEKDHVSPSTDEATSESTTPRKSTRRSEMLKDSAKSASSPIVENRDELPVKATLNREEVDKGNENGTTNAEKKVSSCNISSEKLSSFKRKIAHVLSTLGSRQSYTSPGGKDDENEEDSEEKPRKKLRTSKSVDDNNEDQSDKIKGRPMPASVREKLESRRGQEADSPPAAAKMSSDDSSSIHELECEVCHRVFTNFSNRQRHERTVHSIANPRGRGVSTPTTPAVAEEKKVKPPSEKSTKSSSNGAASKGATKPLIDLASLPRKKSGRCPVCNKFMTNLRRHLITVHKELFQDSSPSASAVPAKAVSNRAPKSYKIYKATTNKIKQKLVATSSPTKAVARNEPAPEPEPDVEEKKSKPEKKKSVPEVTSKTKKSESQVIMSMGVTTSDVICACCDKTFTVKCDFNRHMEMKHPKMKRLISCRLCGHMFSHEGDFILHIQFRHRDLVSGMEERSKKNSGSNKSEHAQETSPKFPGKPTSTASIRISQADRNRADAAVAASNKLSSTQRLTERLRTMRSTPSKPKSPSPEPENEPMDTYDDDDHHDDHFEDTEMQETEETEIAITSTFSQKEPTPPPRKSVPKSHIAGKDEMPCSTCTEVFYSYEALRKHELYFHNVKTTKMCPICGIYPTRLGRHLLAHDNKSVRCACVPCRLSFRDFGEMLNHNLKKHPGPNGGAVTTPNKPQPTPEVPQPENNEFRCKLCKKISPGEIQARRHVRRVHFEIDDDADNHIEMITSSSSSNKPKSMRERESGSEKGDDNDELEMGKILEETNEKLQDPDWDNDDDDYEPPPPALDKFGSTPPSPTPPPPPTELNTRAMPGSVRAKLDSLFSKRRQFAPTNPSDNPVTPPEPKAAPPKPSTANRPLPASVRARMEMESKRRDSTDSSSTPAATPKPSRPMPASVRAKLAAQSGSSTPDHSSTFDKHSDTSGSDKISSSVGRRAMPASVKAKLSSLRTTQSATSVLGAFSRSEEPDNSSSDKPSSTKNQRPEVVTVSDDDIVELESPAKLQSETTPTFSIAEEIAEHNRAVRIAMGEADDPSRNIDMNQMIKCKLCDKKFDNAPNARRHIRKQHSDFGPEHTESLMELLYDVIADTPRKRKSRINYTEDYEDDEVFIPRGTSSRPKGPRASWATTSDDEDKPSNSYACRICGTRKNRAINIRRHISKAHKTMWRKTEPNDFVVCIEPGKEEEFERTFTPMLNNAQMLLPTPEQVSMPPPPPRPDTGPVAYRCKVCSQTADKRATLYQHIRRSHPDAIMTEKSSDLIEDVYDMVALQNGSIDAVIPDDNVFSCNMCTYSSTDEHEYVRHYKKHTGGVSPYQCQYCSATFNRNQQLTSHITREHTGAEFLNNDEAEITMEEMVEVGEISVTTSSRIEIDQPLQIMLNQRHTQNDDSEANPLSEVKKIYRPGPASRKIAKKSEENSVAPTVSSPARNDDEDNTANTRNNCDAEEEAPQSSQPASTGFAYQGDLSSLFPSLGGAGAPGGLEAMDDIDGGMELD